MSNITIRNMQNDDWGEVAELIRVSLNQWYIDHGGEAKFTGPADSTLLFCQVYEALDPGCCVVAEVEGRIAGSCFFHPRPSHVSLGVMNAHPNFFGRGIARRLLQYITDYSDDLGLPVRLVSSAGNIDSYSLYNKAGFVPQQVLHDMLITIPEEGLNLAPEGIENVRQATLDDVSEIVALEERYTGIWREKDFRYFINNRLGIWHTVVYENAAGKILGVLASVAHPASNIIGPGVMQNQAIAAALIAAQLDHHRGRTPLLLIPAQCNQLVHTLYGWGAKNCEIHLTQIRGPATNETGVIMPTFMPETG